MSRRIERVNEMLRRELALLVSETATGDLPMIAIDYVETSPDLKSARVYVSLIGSPGQRSEMIQFLESNRREFQQAIAKQGTLKFTPVLDFRISHFDDSSTKVEQLIDKIHEP